MIKQDFISILPEGLYCSYGSFYLDPSKAVKTAVISHAHADHATGGNATVHATAATIAFMQHRYKKNAGGVLNTHSYHEPFDINGVRITFIPAGHMLGSAMILMEHDGVKYLYTGDYMTDENATCEPLEFIKADVLITESTFADPEVQHPSAIDEIKKLNGTDVNVLLGAYALGKSQRITQLITTHCPEKKVLLHHSIIHFHRIYESFGMNVGTYELYNRKIIKEPNRKLVYIVPPFTFDSYFRAKNVVRAFASGWGRLQRGNDLSLYISDHTDWNGILHMIEQVQPTEVWTLHGDGRHLQSHYADKLTVKLLNR